MYNEETKEFHHFEDGEDFDDEKFLVPSPPPLGWLPKFPLILPAHAKPRSQEADLC